MVKVGGGRTLRSFSQRLSADPTTVIMCAQCASSVKSTSWSIQPDHHSHSPSEFSPSLRFLHIRNKLDRWINCYPPI